MSTKQETLQEVALVNALQSNPLLPLAVLCNEAVTLALTPTHSEDKRAALALASELITNYIEVRDRHNALIVAAGIPRD